MSKFSKIFENFSLKNFRNFQAEIFENLKFSKIQAEIFENFRNFFENFRKFWKNKIFENFRR